MPVRDADKLLEQLDMILAPLDDDSRDLMKEWARREMVENPVTTMITKRCWVKGWEEEDDKGQKRTIPSGYHSLTWQIGHSSPQNPEALVFAIFIVDVVTAHVFSFAPVKTEDDKDTVIWFKEIVLNPDTTFGPVAGEALVLDWARLLQDEDEHEQFMEGRTDALEKGKAGVAAGVARGNGAAS
jgi:hypothetical protein